MEPESNRIEISTGEYFLNIRMIDEQHKQFIDTLNNIVNLSNAKQDASTEKLGEVLHELEEYLKYHFSTEEMYMELAEYEDIDVHKSEHK